MNKGCVRLILYNLVGPLVLCCGVAALLYLVPWSRIRELARIGIVGGFGVALVIIELMQNLWGFWLFHQVDLVDFYRIPLALSLTWMPLVIIFSHLMLQYRQPLLRVGILIVFPAAATIFHFLLLKGGFLTYYRWNLFGTFLFSLIIHAGIAGYLFLIRSARTKL